MEIGTGSYGEPTVRFWEPEGCVRPHVRIGSYSSIAAEVTIIVNGDHRIDWLSTYPFREMLQLEGTWSDGHPKLTGPVTIGSDVWIGHGATILGGVSIGHGAVVGAGSVVTRDVQPYSGVAGNPAQVKNMRFSDPDVATLLDLRWWELSHHEVSTLIPVLCSATNVDVLRVRVAEIRQGQSQWEPPKVQ